MYGASEVTYPLLASFPEAQLAAPSRHDLLKQLTATLEKGLGVAVVVFDADQAKTDFLNQLATELKREQLVLQISKQAPGCCYRQLAAQLSLADQPDDASALTAAVDKAICSESARNITVLCDDVDEYNSEMLEQLQQISQLVPAGGKHLNLVLCGSPHLLKCLRTAALQSLRQRVTKWLQLTPLSRTDVALYLEAVQKQAGGELSKITFYPTFVHELQRLSQGRLEIVNRLADASLARAMMSGQTNPGMDDVKRSHYFLGYATLSGTALGWGTLAAVALIATAIGSYCLGMSTGEKISAGTRHRAIAAPSYVTFRMDENLTSGSAR
jgi:type II secretory pathway predicted ATPase ExeA